MSDKSEIALRINQHPIEAAIRRHPKQDGAFYTVSFGHYFNTEDQGEGWERLEDISERDLPVLAKIVELVQVEILKLREADASSDNPSDAD